ncbi:HugZ family protein [Pacificibacter marinus]|uniref:HugZ family pyridoxamine 5'-phosphate oxidase n=1 Tax=Pacificibacter marinus TaxID=658057 RepID=UPI001C065D4E|nr:pyridoxamine 5'-phosphate oxidase family protein [Pacificibacter marinus]MBU2865737.1 pyridoxamine 5'-phosphate oxidase family protein [Pacificibacter marinus]
MTDKRPSPIRETDDTARATARDLIENTRHAALAVLDETGAPSVTRIAFGQSGNGQLLSLVSDLSAHSKRLKADPRCSLLIGDLPSKGDPLAFARLSITAEAQFLSRDDLEHAKRRAEWLATHPKSGLYVDFSDFNFVRFTPLRADLNGGFGKAYQLSSDDLAMRA